MLGCVPEMYCGMCYTEPVEVREQKSQACVRLHYPLEKFFKGF